jgi:hypothetical protein
MAVDKKRVQSLIGKYVYVMTREGEVREGVLDKMIRDKIYFRTNEKPVNVNAFFNPFTPLVLFDLLAIEESPFFFSPFFF